MNVDARNMNLLVSPKAALAAAVGTAALLLPSTAAAIDRPPDASAKAVETPAALITASQVSCTAPVERTRHDGRNDEVRIRTWSCARNLGRMGLTKTSYREVDFYSRRGDTYYTRNQSREAVRHYDRHGHLRAATSSLIISPQQIMSSPPDRQPIL